MALSPLKRSASDAQLSDLPHRPNKAARTSINTMVKAPHREEEPGRGALAKWSEVGRLTVGACRAFGGAVYASCAAAWKGIYIFAFRDTDELALPTHRPASRKLLPRVPQPPKAENAEAPQSAEPPSTSKPPPHAQTNHSPTNLHASSSSSAAAFYPPAQEPSTSSTTSSSPDLSRTSGVESTSTQTSIPTSPVNSNSKSGREPDQMDAVQRMITQNNTNGLLGSGVLKKYKRRHHIYEAQHRQRVKEYLERELYERTRMLGYSSDFDTFRGYMQYRRRLEELQRNELNRSRAGTRSPTPILPRDEVEFFQRAMEKATKSLQSPKPPKPFSPTLEELSARTKYKNERIFNRLHPKRKPIPDRLPSDAEKEVKVLLSKRGVVSKAGREQVSDTDIARLMPGQWLNDEIINFYGQLITERAAEAEATKENVRGKLLNVHYFSTFFWPKLQSGYEKGRLAKWTKKVDIFSKDLIIMAINHGNAHWTSAAIDFKKKRIISFDSMGFYRSEVNKALRNYLNEEHKNKKKKPFDFTGWEDYRSDTYPEQENGYDCGVFTCQALEHLSRGEDEFSFTQQNMPYFRQRMIWEIGRAKLGDPL